MTNQQQPSEGPHSLPPASAIITGKPYQVRCQGYRCLAYCDARGAWRNFHTDEALPEVLEVLGD